MVRSCCGIGEEVFRLVLFHDLTGIHEDHPVGDLAGKAHFVGDAEHGHAFFGETDHHVQNFLDHFRVERRSRLIEQHDLRVHAKRAGNCHALLLATGQLTRIFQGPVPGS